MNRMCGSDQSPFARVPKWMGRHAWLCAVPKWLRTRADLGPFCEANLESILSNGRGYSDIQALWEHCGPLSKCNKHVRSLGGSVGSPVYCTSSSSTNIKGALTSVT